MHDTRGRLVLLLRKSGGQTVGQLTEALGVTRAAVMSHLAALRAQGFVVTTELRAGPRRPSLVYALTPAADELFPKAYQDVAALILEEIAQEGSDRLRAFLQRVGDRWVAQDLPRLEGLGARERLDRAMQILSERGFLPELERTNAEYVLREHNCPVMRLATSHAEVCDMIHRWLQTLIGTPLTRTRCMRDGDLFSAYAFKNEEGSGAVRTG